jgi:hypothetical protein
MSEMFRKLRDFIGIPSHDEFDEYYDDLYDLDSEEELLNIDHEKISKTPDIKSDNSGSMVTSGSKSEPQKRQESISRLKTEIQISENTKNMFISHELNLLLDNLSKKTDLGKTEIVVRSIALMDLAIAAKEREERVCFLDKNGYIRHEIVGFNI